jgi:choice-of-anchor C domain-containing protein
MRRGLRRRTVRAERLEPRFLLAATPVVSIADTAVAEGDEGVLYAAFPITLSEPASQDVTVHYRTADGTAASITDSLNHVDNGGFEEPTVLAEWSTFFPGSELGAWHVDGGGVDIVAGWQDAEGNQAVDLNARDPGSVYQDVATVPGQVYLLRFAFSGNPERAIPVKQMDVSFGGMQVATESFDTTGRSTSNMGWVRRTYEVVATASTTRLRFASLTTLSDAGPMIDDVSLVPAGDYVPSLDGAVTIPAGQTQATVRVPVVGDTLDEPDETFTVTLTGATGGAIVASGAGAVGTGTILNDDAPPTISVSDVVVTEGTGRNPGESLPRAKFVVTLSRPARGPLTVDYATVAGTAMPGLDDGDYFDASGTITFLRGQASATVGIEIAPDGRDEPDETFFFNLSSPVGATLADAQAVGIIVDDDDVASAVAIGDVTVTEGDAGSVDAIFPVTLSAPSGWPVTVRWAVADGTATAAGNDYAAAPGGVLTFAPGETSKTVTVRVNGDTTLEPNETFFVQLSDPTHATLAGDGRATGTIASDELPVLSVDDVTVTEGNPGDAPVTATFTLRLSSAVPFPVSVRYDPAAGTATLAPAPEGGDFAGEGGTIEFAPGQTTQSVAFSVWPDALDEADETFFLNLSGLDGASLPDAQAVATIVDDDAPPAMTVTGPTVTEGNGGATDAAFTFSLSGPSGRTVTVDYATADGTATAAPGIGNLVSDPSFETVQIAVPWQGYSAGAGFGGWLVEAGNVEIVSAFQAADGRQSIDLSGVSRGTLYKDVQTTSGGLYLLRFALSGNPQGGPAVKTMAVSFGAASLGELTFDTTGRTIADMGWQYRTFVVSAPSASTRLRFISLTDGAAGPMIDDVSLTPFGDYVAAAGTLTFAPGETSKTVIVPVVGDRLDEDDETFRLLLSNASGASPPPAEVVGTILDDDTTPPDRYEPNDTIEAATELGTLGARSIPGLTLHARGNVDYFRFAAGYTGASVVTAGYAADGGTRMVEVLDASGAVIASSSGPGGFSRPSIELGRTLAGVRVPSVAGQTYYVRVSGEQRAVDADYTLSVTNAAGDRFEPNDTPDLASDLGVLGQRTEAALRIEDRLDRDMFRFTAGGSGPLSVSVESVTGGGFALLELFDAAGTRLASVPGPIKQTPSGIIDGKTMPLISTVAAGQVYYLRVSHGNPGPVGASSGTGGFGYDLRIMAPGAGPVSLPRLSVSDFSISEGNGPSPRPFSFTVSLSGPLSTPVTVHYSTADGTAVSGVGGDYQAASGTLVIPAGQRSASIVVLMNGDTQLEPSEQFFLNLTDAEGAVIQDGQAVGTIANDDSAPPRVMAVYLGGTGWSRSFLGGLESRGLGSFQFGYAIPAGPRQLEALPWTGINQVSIQLIGGESTSDIIIGRTNLTVTGAGGRQYPVINFRWDYGTRTGTWTLGQPVVADTLVLELDGTTPGAVRNLRGFLDGEWTGGASGSFPSGDGTEGGNFRFRVNVLPGDGDGDGRVSLEDFGAVRLRSGRRIEDRPGPWAEPPAPRVPLARAAPAYSIFHDINADGMISALDQSLARRNLFGTLPAGGSAASITRQLFGTQPVLA